MEIATFTEEAPGKLVKIPEGVHAFVPNPLPPTIQIDAATADILSKASQAIGELKGTGAKLPNPYLLIRPFMRREAVLSSRIEGTFATPEELLLFEATPTEDPPRNEIREVANYVRALGWGLKKLNELPVSHRLIKEAHHILLAGVRGEESCPGEFRNRQNFIGGSGQSIYEARFVPPPVEDMQAGMDDFEKYLHAKCDLPFLIRLPLIHYQFEALHPFVDGNGRVGRLLIVLLLAEREYLPEPLLYLSAYFDRNRDAYIDHLLRVSQAGMWLEWIRFFLQGIVEEAHDAIRRSQRLLALREELRGKVQMRRSSALLPKLVDELIAVPAITIPQARKILGVTYRSAQLNIKKLVDAGILKEVAGRKRNRVYYAPSIISIIEADKA